MSIGSVFICLSTLMVFPYEVIENFFKEHSNKTSSKICIYCWLIMSIDCIIHAIGFYHGLIGLGVYLLASLILGISRIISSIPVNYSQPKGRA